MIHLDRIEDSDGIDLDKTDKSKECKICHYNYFLQLLFATLFTKN